jgi:cytochrome c oxidase assembly protein subunit 11
MDDLNKKNRRTGYIVLGLVLGMSVLTASSVELYKLYCKMTGFGGKAEQSTTAKSDVILNREIKVRFNTDVSVNLPWEFKSDQEPVTVKLGQEAAVSFSATNLGNQGFAGTALYNVDPPAAGVYFHKTQCFCFDYQLIAPKKQAHFPVVFYIDPELDKDPQLKDLKSITLSYSFFKADSPELEKALEDFYKSGNSGTTSVKIK